MPAVQQIKTTRHKTGGPSKLYGSRGFRSFDFQSMTSWYISLELRQKSIFDLFLEIEVRLAKKVFMCEVQMASNKHVMDWTKHFPDRYINGAVTTQTTRVVQATGPHPTALQLPCRIIPTQHRIVTPKQAA